MSENKADTSLTYAEFSKKYPELLTFKQIDAKMYRELVALKAVQEQTKDYNFSESWTKEIETKIEEITPLVKDELKQASDNIDNYILKLMRAVFEFFSSIKEMPSEDDLKKYEVKMRQIITVGVTMDAEYIFNMTQILYIN